MKNVCYLVVNVGLGLAFEEQPAILNLGKANQTVPPGEALPLDVHDNLSVSPSFGLKGAPVPDLDRAGAIFAFSNRTFERCVVYSMVFNLNREPAYALRRRGLLGDCPAHQDAVPLQSQVPMQAPGLMTLNYIDRIPRLSSV